MNWYLHILAWVLIVINIFLIIENEKKFSMTRTFIGIGLSIISLLCFIYAKTS